MGKLMQAIDQGRVVEFQTSFQQLLVYMSKQDQFWMTLKPEQDRHLLAYIDELAENIRLLDKNYVPHDAISQVMFNVSLDKERIDVLVKLLLMYFDTDLDKIDDPSFVQEKYLKIISSIRLADTQVSYLYRQQRLDIDELTTKTQLLEQDLNMRAQTLKQELDTGFKVKVDGMYASFISVLGIFVTISFTLFGAATLLNNIFNAQRPLGDNIMLAGFASLLIYLLIVGLLVGLRTLIGISDVKQLKNVGYLSAGVVSVIGTVIVIGFTYGHHQLDLQHVAWMVTGVGAIWHWLS